MNSANARITALRTRSRDCNAMQRQLRNFASSELCARQECSAGYGIKPICRCETRKRGRTVMYSPCETNFNRTRTGVYNRCYSIYASAGPSRGIERIKRNYLGDEFETDATDSLSIPYYFISVLGSV